MITKRNLKDLRAAKQVARDKYAWPGGYPMFLVMSDGGCLCPDCVKRGWRSIVAASLRGLRDGWKPEDADINYEDTELFCDHCSKQIEAAYTD